MNNPRPNSGSLFEARPGAKVDFSGNLNVTRAGDYVVFGRRKNIKRKSDGKQFNIIELSLMEDNQQGQRTAPPSNSPITAESLEPQRGDLPF